MRGSGRSAAIAACERGLGLCVHSRRTSRWIGARHCLLGQAPSRRTIFFSSRTVGRVADALLRLLCLPTARYAGAFSPHCRHLQACRPLSFFAWGCAAGCWQICVADAAERPLGLRAHASYGPSGDAEWSSFLRARRRQDGPSMAAWALHPPTREVGDGGTECGRNVPWPRAPGLEAHGGWLASKEVADTLAGRWWRRGKGTARRVLFPLATELQGRSPRRWRGDCTTLLDTPSRLLTALSAGTRCPGFRRGKHLGAVDRMCEWTNAALVPLTP